MGRPEPGAPAAGRADRPALDDRPRVLIVEDDIERVAAWTDLLRRHGLVVESASDGLAGLALIDTGPLPDVIVLDLALPILSGEAVAREVRGRVETKAIPIVAVTALDAGRARQAGCEGFVAAPGTPDDLVAELRRVLARP
jgi:CheY-like chemotaxis protein